MFTASYTLGLKRYSAGAKDARGNAVPTFADPVDWRVFSIVPGSGDSVSRGGGAGLEPPEPHRDLSVIEYFVTAPDDENVPTERDVVVYDGQDYQVAGRPDHWNTASPWGWAPVVVRLRRTEG